MICPPCRNDSHGLCAGGTWCDCQHAPRKAGEAAGSVRELPRIEADGSVARLHPGRHVAHTEAGPLGGAGFVRGLNGGGLASGGPGCSQLHTLTHWWYDCDRWVGSL